MLCFVAEMTFQLLLTVSLLTSSAGRESRGVIH